MKKIAYVLTTSGIDGMAPTEVMAAFWEERDRDIYFEGLGGNKPWYSKAEIIVDVEKDTVAAKAKLNGLDKLLLNIPMTEKKKYINVSKPGRLKL